MLFAAVLAAGCPSTEPARSKPPPPAVPQRSPVEVPRPPTASASTAEPGEPDYWVKRFGAYMSPAFLQEYLATPDDERFAKYGEKLLDFQRRESLLEKEGGRLGKAEIEQYRALPDYEASRRFLEAKPP